MPCENAAQSDDYFEFIGEYSGVVDYVKEEFNTECITVIDQRFAIAYVPKNGRTSIYGQNCPYNTIPRCFGLMDTQMLEDVGVAQVRRSTLELYGNGVLVGMIDTGIDYEHQAFRYEDGSSKIYSLWDQTIKGNPEDTFLGYGTEYTKEQIEEALRSKVPQEKVPSKDESGHGTFLAGLIAGNEDNEAGFSGIAPNAGLIVVKLRKAKDYLKEYYCIDPKYEVYAETDIMLAVRYIDAIAEQLQRPVVIFLGIGTSLASHLGTGPLDQYLSGRAMLRGVAVVTSAGNEGQARHHYSGKSRRIRIWIYDGIMGISTKPILCGYRITIWTENGKDSRRIKRTERCHIFTGKNKADRGIFYSRYICRSTCHRYEISKSSPRDLEYLCQR